MNNHEFICQDSEVIDAIFNGLFAHLKEHHGITLTHIRYAGDMHIDKTEVAAWLLCDKDNNARFYAEYNAEKNELNCRRINILEIDYKIPEPKSDPVDAEEELRQFFKSFYESKSKPQLTLKSIINSSMDELMSEIASMKQKAQPTMNKMERVYKAMMTELSKDD